MAEPGPRSTAGQRARDYLRLRPTGTTPATNRQVLNAAVLNGLVFAVLLSLWEGLTDGWGEVTVGSFLFAAVFFGLFMGVATLLTRARAGRRS